MVSVLYKPSYKLFYMHRLCWQYRKNYLYSHTLSCSTIYCTSDVSCQSFIWIKCRSECSCLAMYIIGQTCPSLMSYNFSSSLVVQVVRFILKKATEVTPALLSFVSFPQLADFLSCDEDTETCDSPVRMLLSSTAVLSKLKTSVTMNGGKNFLVSGVFRRQPEGRHKYCVVDCSCPAGWHIYRVRQSPGKLSGFKEALALDTCHQRWILLLVVSLVSKLSCNNK